MNIVCAPYVCVGKVFFLRKKFPLLQIARQEWRLFILFMSEMLWFYAMHVLMYWVPKVLSIGSLL